MSGSLLEVLTENEYRANRSCAVAALWTAAVVLSIVAIGFTGALYISWKWMLFYFAGIVLPMLMIAAYAKWRKYRGAEIKFLMVLGSAFIPVCMSIPSAFGFFLMALPIVVSARYLSRKFVWETYAMVVCLTVLTTIPHAAFGLPISTIEDANIPKFSVFLADGTIDRVAYWKGLLAWCAPSHAICLGFFAIILSRLCRDGQEVLEHQAQVHARLADVAQVIAQTGDRKAIVSEGVLDDLFLFMMPSDKRLITFVRDREPAYGRELAKWVREKGERRKEKGESAEGDAKFIEDLEFAAELGPRALVDEWGKLDPQGFHDTVLTPVDYFPTVADWRKAYGLIRDISSSEPLAVYLKHLLGACGNTLGCKALEAGDEQTAWQTFWEILDKVDKENYSAIVNLEGMIQRGAPVTEEARKKLNELLMAVKRRLKSPERLLLAAQIGGRLYVDPKVRERYELQRKEALAKNALSPRAKEFIATVAAAPQDRKSAEKARQAIRKAVKDGLVRIDRIGDQLLGIDVSLNDWTCAELDALDVLRFDRHHLRANAVMGTVNGMRGEFEAAERYLRRALAAGTNDATACNDLAFLLVCQEQAKDAIPLARLAARLRPLDWNFRETLAIALIRGGAVDEGEVELKAAEDLAAQAGVPKGKIVRFNLDRAWLYKARGESAALQVTLTNLLRTAGLEKKHMKEIEALGK